MTRSSRSGPRLLSISSWRATRSSNTISVASTARNPDNEVARSRARSVSEILFTVTPSDARSQGMYPPRQIPSIGSNQPRLNGAPCPGAGAQDARITIRSGGLQNWSVSPSLNVEPAGGVTRLTAT